MNQAKRTVQKRDWRQRGGFKMPQFKGEGKLTYKEIRCREKLMNLVLATGPNLIPTESVEKAFVNRRKALDGYPYKAANPKKPQPKQKTLRELRRDAMKAAGHKRGDNTKFLFNPDDSASSSRR